MPMLPPCPTIQPVFWHPPIGVCIAFLGFVGVIVPLLREKIGRKEKAAWTILLTVFLILEVVSIRLEEAKTDREHNAALCQQTRDFQTVVDGLKQATEQSKGQYASTLTHVADVLKTTQDVAAIAKQDLDSVTGGKRVLALGLGQVNGDSFLPFVFAPQRGIVRKTTIRIVNLSLFQEDEKRASLGVAWSSHDVVTEVGDLGTGFGIGLTTPIELGPGESVKFNIFFASLNGGWTENLWCKKRKGKWTAAIRVFEPYTALPKGKRQPKVVFEQVPPGFVESGEKTAWEHY